MGVGQVKTHDIICFWRGNNVYQVAPAREGPGFIGLRDGRIVATAPDRAGVMRTLILAARWLH